MGCEDVLD